MEVSFCGKENRLSFGVYPDVGLKAARKKRDDARYQLATGIDPRQARKAEKISIAGAESFETISREWHANSHLDGWRATAIASCGGSKTNLPLAWEATHRRNQSPRGARSAASNRKPGCTRDCPPSDAELRTSFPLCRSDRTGGARSTGDLRGALPPPKEKHHASIIEPKRVAELLRAIDSYRGFFATRCALQLAPLVFVRPGELRKAQWSEIEFDNEQWRIPANRMKMREQHIVPLSGQAIEILRNLEPLTNRPMPSKPNAPCYVFPSARTRVRPMSNNAILAALRRMGYTKEEMTGHGFRSMASTLLHEQGWNHQVIERQLAHAERNA